MKLSPEAARQQLRSRKAGTATICEVHRSLYRGLQDLPPEERAKLEPLLITAYIMAKKMANRLLRHYKDTREGY